MASDDIQAFDRASLDQFVTELIRAGFELTGTRTWTGPIHSGLTQFTDAPTMRITIDNGWPYRWPRLFVDGIHRDHANPAGEVCLWQPGDSSAQWETFAGFEARISTWCEARKEGFRPEDVVLDAHLSFDRHQSAMALVDLDALTEQVPAGREHASGKLSGQWEREGVLDLVPGEVIGMPMAGRWIWSKRAIAPPADFDEVRAAVPADEVPKLERFLERLPVDGTISPLLLAWETAEHGRTALALVVSRVANEVGASALELAPTDLRIRRLRAGPDAEALADKSVTIFGIGAIGSNVALRLAEAGVGTVRLIDGDQLRPGNIVRHAASGPLGAYKADAVADLIRIRAPWSAAIPIQSSPWTPAQLEAQAQGSDLVVEGTGLVLFSQALELVTRGLALPFVSAALYRAGAIARVRRSDPAQGDTTITERRDNPGDRYPIIPVGDEPRRLEPGCTAAVNNASPVAVAAVAALTAEIAIDTLLAEFRFPDEVLEVYRPLDSPPFDTIGRLTSG